MRSPVPSCLRHTLAAALLALLAAAPAAAQDYPRLALHARFYGNGYPFIDGGTRNGPLNPEVIQAAARHHEVTLGASPTSEYRPDLAAALRLARPDIRLYAYVIAQHVWDAADDPDSLVDYITRYRRLVRGLDGYLYNRAGGRYAPANVNLAKRDGLGRFVVAEGIVDLWQSVVLNSGLWDGMFLDQYCNGILWTQSPAESIDFVRAGYPSAAAFDAAWLAATDTIASRLRRLAGPDFLLVGNCGQGTKYASFNGWMRENFPYQNGGTWYENMFREPGGYFTDEANFRQPASNYIFSAAVVPSQPYASSATRKVRFGLGSAALGSGYGIYAPSDLDAITYPYHWWWYDEFAVNLRTGESDTTSAFTGWLGQPLGGPYQMIWVGTNPDAVTNPDFETDVTTGWQFANAVAATVTRDPSSSARGFSSARISVPAPAPYEYWVSYSTTGRLAVSAGQLYSATFWAKASVPFTLPVVAGISGAGGVAMRSVAVDTTWRQYQVALVPSRADNVQLQFYVGLLQGELWLDDVHFQAGASSLWRRDFQNGTVLVNPASGAMTAPLERDFQRIRGLRDPVVNSGAVVTQVTVPASDALFLIGRDLIPPAPVSDLHPTPGP